MSAERIRRQLTLFVPPAQSAALEAVRRLVDPVQHGLIAAHVTLCRDAELADWDALARRLAALAPPALTLTLRFGAPAHFHGHGIWVECIDGAERFRALRAALLGSGAIAEQAPHITLAHPRNPRAPGNALAAAQSLPQPLTIRFDTCSLIEQHGQDPWRRIADFPWDQTAAY
jgi:hypothetical protein